MAEVRQLGVAFHQALLTDVEFILADQFEELGMAQAIGGRFLQPDVEGLAQAGETKLFQSGFEVVHGGLVVIVAKQSGTQSR